MRCKVCEYRLWNLRSRRCPECGTPFVPSEFEFTPSSVQYRCPHCDQAYYGIGEKGHLAPREFDCLSCGKHIHMDEMVLLPTEGWSEEQTQVDRLPWLERKKRGRVRAWWETVKMALFTPGRAMRCLPPDSPLSSALWFAAVTNTLVTFTSLAPIFILIPVILGVTATRGGGGGSAGTVVLSVVGGVVAYMLASLAATAIVVAIWGVIVHGVLRLTGPTDGSLRRTLQAMGYSTGANIVSGVPCVGLYFGWIWWVVSAVCMLMEAQRVRAARAVVAVLGLPVLGIMAYIGLIIAMLARAGPGAFGPVATTGPASATNETQVVLNALQQYAGGHNGRGPDHAIQLVTADLLTPADFAIANSMTMPENIPVGGTTLGRFMSASTSRQEIIAEKAVKSLPKSTIAHRLGDFVFTHHGIDWNTADPGLWVVVMCPNPPFPGWGPATTVYHVGCADGTIITIRAADMPRELNRQNALRRRSNLPPLPDPNSVTHTSPAAKVTGAVSSP